MKSTLVTFAVNFGYIASDEPHYLDMDGHPSDDEIEAAVREEFERIADEKRDTFYHYITEVEYLDDEEDESEDRVNV